MKSLFSGLAVAAAVTLVFLGCGAERPFDRGQRISGPGDIEGKPTPDPSGTPGPTPSEALSEEFFVTKVLPLLESDCTGCHENKAGNYETAKSLVVKGDFASSPLVRKAQGLDGHDAIWEVGSEALKALKAWIEP